MRRASPWLLALVVVLVALNLRAFLTSTSPLLAPIRAATGIGFQAVALLTVLPMATMGVLSLLGVAIGQRFGARRGVAWGLGAIALACASRAFHGSAAVLLLSAALAGLGVGLVQALMPGAIKLRFAASSLGLAMGLYSAALMGGGGLGAVLSPWFAQTLAGPQGLAWQAALGLWALPAVFGIGAWLLLWPHAAAPDRTHAAAAVTSPSSVAWQRCFGNRRAWLLALCFGLFNGGYTSLVAWLPSFYAQQGASAQRAGGLLALMTLAQLMSALLMPVLARRHSRDLRGWLMLCLLLQLGGFSALMLDLPLPPAAVVFGLGLGLGGAFSLCMLLALDHLPNAAQAGALAGFMQGVGFVIAALAPFITGWVRAQTDGFAGVWAYLAAVVLVMVPLMARFRPAGYVAATAGLFPAPPARG